MNETKWIVQLVGETGGKDDSDLVRLSEHFIGNGVSVYWLESRGAYFLEWKALQNCTDPALVFQLSKGAITALNGAMKVKEPAFRPIRHGGVCLQKGLTFQYFEFPTVYMGMRASVEASTVAERVLPTKGASDYFAISQRNRDAAELLEYLSYPDQGWIELYWTYEVLCRVRAHHTFAVQDEMKRFSDTANDRRAGAHDMPNGRRRSQNWLILCL